jgi:sugar/nucleoside kinase (ribokinase family)
MFPDFGANLHVHLDEARTQAIREASVLVMSAYTLMRPETVELAEQALEIAIESGTRIVVDAASSAPIRAWGANKVRSFLVRADLVLANDDEIQSLTEDGHETWLHTLPNVIIKHGAGGASWWSQGELHTQIPALEIDVVDTTGAGDALCGGLVAALVGHDDWAELSDAVRFEALTQAIQTASTCCQQVGAWPREGN